LIVRTSMPVSALRRSRSARESSGIFTERLEESLGEARERTEETPLFRLAVAALVDLFNVLSECVDVFSELLNGYSHERVP